MAERFDEPVINISETVSDGTNFSLSPRTGGSIFDNVEGAEILQKMKNRNKLSKYYASCVDILVPRMDTTLKMSLSCSMLPPKELENHGPKVDWFMEPKKLDDLAVRMISSNPELLKFLNK